MTEELTLYVHESEAPFLRCPATVSVKKVDGSYFLTLTMETEEFNAKAKKICLDLRQPKLQSHSRSTTLYLKDTIDPAKVVAELVKDGWVDVTLL